MRSHSKEGKLYGKVERIYGRMIGWSLRHRFWMLLIAAAVSISAILLFPRVGKELVPDDDQSEFTVVVRLPRGTSLDATDDVMREIERDVRQIPHVQTVYTSVSPARGDVYLGLESLEKRELSQQDLMRQARLLMRKYPRSRISIAGGTDLSGASSSGGRSGGGTSNRLYMNIQGPDIDQLQVYTRDLMSNLRTIPGVVDVDTFFEPTQQELRVNIDRQRAADLGVSIDSLAANLRTLVGGEEVSRFKDGDDQYIVRLRLDEPYRSNPTTMGQLLIPSSTQRDRAGQ